MANANMTPMPFVRKFGSNAGSSEPSSSSLKDEESDKKLTLSALAQSAFPSRYDPNAFVDISGAAISAPTVTGACKRCGYPGHLYFQCRNFIQIRPNQSTKAYDVSSTSSESSDDETPLVEQRKHEKKQKKKERKERKKARKLEKKERKKAKKEKRKRRDDSDDSDDDEDVKSKKKKSKKMKKEKRKRRHSTSDSSSDSDSEDDRRDSKRRRRS